MSSDPGAIGIEILIKDDVLHGRFPIREDHNAEKPLRKRFDLSAEAADG
jgi:hypothetical protein